MQAQEPHSRSADECFPSKRQLFLLLLIYFGLHVVIRILVSPTADLDEAEQFVLTQKFSLGYGPQPPFYTWVQIGFFKVFGVTIFALALWKFILLFATHVLTYFNTRFITRSHSCAVAAVASLFLFHQIAWESVRDLTHSVLASTLAAATLFALLRAKEKRTLGVFILFGCCAGLGMLAKYNYLMVLASMTLAALSLPHYRKVILNWRFALAMLIAFLIFLPNGLWMIQHPDLVQKTAYKFYVSEKAGWPQTTLIGFKNLFSALFTYLVLFAGVLAILLLRRGKPVPRLHSEHERLLFRMLLLLGLGFVFLITVFGVTGFKDRWFLSLLISLPVLVFAVFKERIDRVLVKRLLWVSAIIAVLVLTMISVRVRLSETLNFPTHLNYPYDTLAAELKPEFRNVSVVVCDDRQLAGNMYKFNPDKLCVHPELFPIFAPGTVRCALVWDAMRRDEPPDNVVEFAKTFGVDNIQSLSPKFVEAPFKYWHEKKMRLGYVILEKTAKIAP